MEIKNSLDFPRIEIGLQYLIGKVKQPQHRIDAGKILRNLTKMVSELSKLELQQRRSASHSSRLVDQQLRSINTEISSLEQWITLLLLT